MCSKTKVINENTESKMAQGPNQPKSTSGVNTDIIFEFLVPELGLPIQEVLTFFIGRTVLALLS